MTSLLEEIWSEYSYPDIFNKIKKLARNIKSIDDYSRLSNKFNLLQYKESEPEMLYDFNIEIIKNNSKVSIEDKEYFKDELRECNYWKSQKYKQLLIEYLQEFDEKDFNNILNNEIDFIKDWENRINYFVDIEDSDPTFFSFSKNSEIEYLKLCIEIVERLKLNGVAAKSEKIEIPTTIAAKLLILKETGVYDFLLTKTNNNKTDLEKLISYIIGHDKPDNVGRYFAHIGFEQNFKGEKPRNSPYTKPAIKEMKRVLDDCNISYSKEYNRLIKLIK